MIFKPTIHKNYFRVAVKCHCPAYHIPPSFLDLFLYIIELGLILFNNILVISWRSVLLMEKTGVPRENHRPVASQWQTLSHNVVSNTPRHEQDWNSQLSNRQSITNYFAQRLFKFNNFYDCFYTMIKKRYNSYFYIFQQRIF
jgi:hypothetical protein